MEPARKDSRKTADSSTVLRGLNACRLSVVMTSSFRACSFASREQQWYYLLLLRNGLIVQDVAKQMPGRFVREFLVFKRG
jgi:hypothetical protein